MALLSEIPVNPLANAYQNPTGPQVVAPIPLEEQVAAEFFNSIRHYDYDAQLRVLQHFRTLAVEFWQMEKEQLMLTRENLDSRLKIIENSMISV